MIFIDCFKEIEDPRTDINVRHNLLDVIFLTITGIVSGCEGWKDIYEFGVAKLDWLRQYCSFEHGILKRVNKLDQIFEKLRYNCSPSF